MESFSPDELTSRAKQQQEETSTLAGEIVRWFIQEKHLGEMYRKENVIQRLSEYTSSPVKKTRNGLQSVIGDIVDPVQQIVVDGNRYVGAIEYIEFEDSGAYGYTHFDDRLGKRKRVVCAKCVQEETLDENVVHATQGQGSSDIDATWDELANKVKAHYNRSHDSQPEEIYPGASLVSGTTIGGNTAFHQGNEGSINAGVSDHSELSGIGPNDHHVAPDKAYNFRNSIDLSNFGNDNVKVNLTKGVETLIEISNLALSTGNDDEFLRGMINYPNFGNSLHAYDRDASSGSTEESIQFDSSIEVPKDSSGESGYGTDLRIEITPFGTGSGLGNVVECVAGTRFALTNGGQRATSAESSTGYFVVPDSTTLQHIGFFGNAFGTIQQGNIEVYEK